MAFVEKFAPVQELAQTSFSYVSAPVETTQAMVDGGGYKTHLTFTITPSDINNSSYQIIEFIVTWYAKSSSTAQSTRITWSNGGASGNSSDMGLGTAYGGIAFVGNVRVINFNSNVVINIQSVGGTSSVNFTWKDVLVQARALSYD